MKKISKKTTEFNDFRFAGLEWRQYSNNYMTMKRFNDSKDKVVVKVGSSHLFKSKFGYGFILDPKHVLWLKDWQVSDNYYGTEVLLDRKYFTPKEYGDFDDFLEAPEHLDWEYWVETAELQENAMAKDEDGDEYYCNKVKWEI
jgi:hypothetical protein